MPFIANVQRTGYRDITSRQHNGFFVQRVLLSCSCAPNGQPALPRPGYGVSETSSCYATHGTSRNLFPRSLNQKQNIPGPGHGQDQDQGHSQSQGPVGKRLRAHVKKKRHTVSSSLEVCAHQHSFAFPFQRSCRKVDTLPAKAPFPKLQRDRKMICASLRVQICAQSRRCGLFIWQGGQSS
ncbi:hypothetical protein BD289DRAFT_158186 [Coniella lustricola]|uniref:Uncharacterized protein n=1 Tax=Coniella lustricola TaxID=2025994 RepID=A0A2T3AMX3_9PEZI|nr:hypothetical protein BD289DRAFT_158186 [Coniella lustricola]